MISTGFDDVRCGSSIVSFPHHNANLRGKDFRTVWFVIYAETFGALLLFGKAFEQIIICHESIK